MDLTDLEVVDHLHVGEPLTYSLPFPKAPCLCVGSHNPPALLIELHHIFPQADQIAILGSVQDLRGLALCNTGHANVHMILRMLERGDKLPKGLNQYHVRAARLGFARLTIAKRNKAVPTGVTAASFNVPGEIMLKPGSGGS